MLILGVDTSGKHGSFALVRCDSGDSHALAFEGEGRQEQAQSSQGATFQTLEVVPLEGGTFSAELVPQLAALLQKQGLTKQQIDAFAVVSGPGSFTGLRVGLAAIKALSEVLEKPIVAVSRLEAIALAGQVNGRILATFDAGRGDVYLGTYDVHDGVASCLLEEVIALTDLVAGARGKHIVTPDPRIAEAFCDCGTMVRRVDSPEADAIVRIGLRKLQAGQTVSPEALDATYIRRSEAEIKLAERPR